jgi:hypothetical protein
MHQNFADWYRLISIDPQNIPLGTRWAAVEAYASKATTADIFDLMRLATTRSPKDSEFEPRFRGEFKENDDTFSMSQNTLELEVLATSTLIQLIASASAEIADRAALAVLCAEFQGLREKPKIQELLKTAKTYLHSRSDSLRTNNAAPALRLAKSKIPDFVKEITTTPNWATDAPTVGSALEEANKQIVAIAKSSNDALADLTRRLHLQQEESDILWWIFSGYSGDLEVTFSSLGIPAAAIVGGKELADHVINLPGPVAAVALLDKIVALARNRNSKSEYSIKEVVNSRPLKEWRSKHLVMDISGVEDFCSLAYALKQSAALNSSTTWIPDFETRTGLSASDHLSPTQVAEQIYRECLLIRSVR